MNDKKNKFSLFDFLQKFYAQILFIPILFGGISQVISLYLISPNAVRFFSASQAISDGLFFLIVLLLFIVASAILIFFIFLYAAATAIKPLDKQEDDAKMEDNVKVENPESEKYKYSHERMPRIFHLLFFPLILYCYYLLFRYVPSQVQYG